jgi:hypothetical protein
MRMFLAAAMAVLLAGCQAVQGYPAPGMTPKEALGSVSADSAVGAEADYAKAQDDPVLRQQIRDRIVRSRIYVADVNYHEFQRSLSTEQKAFAVGSDIAVLALAGAGTLAKSTRTKTRLAAWSAGVLGGRSAIDKEIYYDKTLPAIVAQMDASRRTVLATLLGGLAQSDADYSLLEAKADLEDYYIAGTLPGALNAISKEAGKQANVADLKIERISEAKYANTAETKRIRAYWKPDGTTVDAAHATAMNEWLRTNAGGTRLPTFMYGATLAQKKAMIDALSIPEQP